ncbi:hypothetical protein C8F04DRAFT_1390905 [Mycena alexandri]|uniref:Uncharacterized protein n=1 Tax=Mycena alexandri TaxID=1745969 RepID=A0AAD6TAK7_9AGAR|nr:hypothetical protein C8F04DRAFT_1390905 [Mycena alexandri]
MAQLDPTNWLKERINDFVKTQVELAERISLAVHPDFAFGSDIDAVTLQLLEDEVNLLKARAERPDMQRDFPYETLEAVRNEFVDMTQQLQSRRTELHPDYEPDFPFAIAPSTPRRAAGELVGPNALPRTLEARAPASGPQRVIPSTQTHRAHAAESPSAKRERLGPPPNPQTFDVVFFPSKAQRSIELPHGNLSLDSAQRTLKALGLIFEVQLPRQGNMVREHFDDQVRAFCEDNHINLLPGEQEDAPLWTLMLVKKKTGKFMLEAELLAPAEFTVATLTGKKSKFSQVRNYLSKDAARQILLIAPINGELDGAITLPGDTSRRMNHVCHVSRLEAAIHRKPAECRRECPTSSDAEAATSGSSHGRGRTLA